MSAVSLQSTPASILNYLGGTFTANTVTATILSAFIIVIFSADRYKLPTSDRSKDGFVAIIPPKFLTSDSRFNHGMRIYIFLILCIFVLITVSGPNVATIFQIGGVSKEVWPLATALALIGLSSASDHGPLGKLEFLIRRFAHERAFVPEGAISLAEKLGRTEQRVWLWPTMKPSQEQLTDLLQMKALHGVPSTKRVAELLKHTMDKVSELAINMQIQDNYLNFGFEHKIKELEDLRKSVQQNDFLLTYYSFCRVWLALDQALATHLIPTNYKFENSEAIQSVLSRAKGVQPTVAKWLASEISESPKSTIREIRDDMALVLASGLLQSRPNDEELTAVFREIGFRDDGRPLRQNWSSFVITVCAVTALGGFVAFVAWLEAGRTLVEFMKFDVDAQTVDFYVSNIGFSLTNGILTYVVLTVIASAYRDSCLRAGTWRNSVTDILPSLMSISFATLLVALIFDVIAAPPNAGIDWLASTLGVVAVQTGFGGVFFMFHMRNAPMAPTSAKSFHLPILRGALLTALLHGICVAVVFFVVLLTTLSWQRGRQLIAASSEMKSLFENYLQEENQAAPNANAGAEPAANAARANDPPKAGDTSENANAGGRVLKDRNIMLYKLIVDPNIRPRIEIIVNYIFARLAYAPTGATIADEFNNGGNFDQAKNALSYLCAVFSARKLKDAMHKIEFSTMMDSNEITKLIDGISEEQTSKYYCEEMLDNFPPPPITNPTSADNTPSNGAVTSQNVDQSEVANATSTYVWLQKISALSELLTSLGEGKTEKGGWFNLAIGSSSAALLAFAFSMGVCSGRREQINDYYGRASREAREALVEQLLRARQSVKPAGNREETAAAAETLQLLTQPIAEIGNLTPLEAFMYDGSYRRLRDYWRSSEEDMSDEPPSATVVGREAAA